MCHGWKGQRPGWAWLDDLHLHGWLVMEQCSESWDLCRPEHSTLWELVEQCSLKFITIFGQGGSCWLGSLPVIQCSLVEKETGNNWTICCDVLRCGTTEWLQKIAVQTFLKIASCSSIRLLILMWHFGSWTCSYARWPVLCGSIVAICVYSSMDGF